MSMDSSRATAIERIGLYRRLMFQSTHRIQFMQRNFQPVLHHLLYLCPKVKCLLPCNCIYILSDLSSLNSELLCILRFLECTSVCMSKTVHSLRHDLSERSNGLIG